MKIKNLLKTLKNISLRRKTIKKSGSSLEKDYIASINKNLHPGLITGRVSSIETVSKACKKIRIESKDVPLFKAGSYASLLLKIENTITSRAYSIISSPLTSYKEKYIEIIAKEKADGFVSTYLCHDLKVDDEIRMEVGLGNFVYEPLRDKNNILAIAGGSGVTPFVSIAKDINERNLDVNITILLGDKSYEDIIDLPLLDSLNSKRVRVVHVLENKYPSFNSEVGFINAFIIKKYLKEDTSIFVSGPKGMKDYLKKELSKLPMDMRKVRFEAEPTETLDIQEEKFYNIEVHIGLEVRNIKAKNSESVLMALERNNIYVHSACRSGECGFCRLKVIKGEYLIREENDHRRYSDKEACYIHSCVTYPLSDMVVKVNIPSFLNEEE